MRDIRHRIILAPIATAAVFLVGLPESVAAQSDCATLQSFVRQAPDGFSSYVGGTAAPESFDAFMNRSPANVSWGDADCIVASRNETLRCSWDHGSVGDSIKMVAACLSGAKEVTAPGETYFTVQPSKVIVTVSGEDGADGVLIEIRAP